MAGPKRLRKNLKNLVKTEKVFQVFCNSGLRYNHKVSYLNDRFLTNKYIETIAIGKLRNIISYSLTNMLLE